MCNYKLMLVISELRKMEAGGFHRKTLLKEGRKEERKGKKKGRAL
jgi:hypothetical protein